MADVRALLRQERAARAPPKQKAAPRAAAPAPAVASKKRKAPEDEDSDDDDARKRARSAGANGLPPNVLDGQPAQTSEDLEEETGFQKVEVSEEVPVVSQGQTQPEIDEDEWAAFERDVATPPPPATSNVLDTLNASNAISSKPLTADELAAQAREEQKAQRSRRDVEREDEKEEADQALAEEFEEMEALEERVRKLRERREGLRRGSVLDQDGSDVVRTNGPEDPNKQLPTTKEEETNMPEDDEDDDDDGDEDDFMFRRPGH